jgi:hypothetical protein
MVMAQPKERQAPERALLQNFPRALRVGRLRLAAFRDPRQETKIQ